MHRVNVVSAVRRRRPAPLALVGALVLLAAALPAAFLSGSLSGRPAGAAGPVANSTVAFGSTPVGSNALGSVNAGVVGMAETPGGEGYWLVASDGGVFSFGDAGFWGSTGSLRLNAPIVGMASTPDGRGYWLVASDGGVFSFGDAGFWGSTGSLRLNAPIVGMASTPDGRGYWLVASDGGVFSFGDAEFWGSAGSIALNANVVGMAPTPSGHGYWLVAADGGIFTYGDAGFWGSAGGIHLNAPVTGMAVAPGGRGYWMVASDGGVFTYGSAAFLGSLGGARPPAAVIGMAATPSGGGYWLVLGSPAPLVGKVVGIDPGHDGENWAAPQVIDQPVWNGTGYEPCDTTGTETAFGFTEAQFNFDVATYLQADLTQAGATVVMTRSTNNGVGPCVTTRAAIIDDAHADVAVDIHADGGPPGGRGFAVLVPVPVGPNDAVIGSSYAFGTIVRNLMANASGMPVSTYDGVDGIQPRSDLAGLNLTTVPKVLIECGNMTNPADAALLASPGFQRTVAGVLAFSIVAFLT
jgi:N-acetylmuramoyl-L-alanine amidase